MCLKVNIFAMLRRGKRLVELARKKTSSQDQTDKIPQTKSKEPARKKLSARRRLSFSSTNEKGL